MVRALARDLIRLQGRSACTSETRACEFWRWGETVRPECCTSHLTELTFFTSDLLTRHGILYWFDFGTLLGAVREQELIRWDRDVDFGVIEPLESLVTLAPEVSRAGYQLRVVDGVVRIYYGPINSNHIDLFPWRRRDGRVDPGAGVREWPGMGGRASFPRSYIETFDTVVLYGRDFPAPRPVDRFLSEHRYGPDYMTPKRQAWFILNLDVSPEELTPEVEKLVDRVTEADEHLLQLLAKSRLARFRPAWVWAASGLPLKPDSRRLDHVRASIGESGEGASLKSLVRSLALLEGAIGELERPEPGVAIRRAYRRAVRAWELIAAAAARRRHRAGFPFGLPT
jgi:hypothetical protein